MEGIPSRLREELKALGKSAAVASREMGLEDGGQGLRDVLSNRKRLSADVLSELAEIGVDALYVLKGIRHSAPSGEKIEWLDFSNPAGRVALPASMAAVAYNRSSGEILVAARLSGDPHVEHCARGDGVVCLVENDELYVPASWLAQEYPDSAAVCKTIRDKVSAEVSQGIPNAIQSGKEGARHYLALTERESKLLNNYRALAEEDRAAIQRWSHALAESIGPLKKNA